MRKPEHSITYMYIRFDLDSRKLWLGLPTLFNSLPNMRLTFADNETTVCCTYSFVTPSLNCNFTRNKEDEVGNTDSGSIPEQCL